MGNRDNAADDSTFISYVAAGTSVEALQDYVVSVESGTGSEFVGLVNDLQAAIDALPGDVLLDAGGYGLIQSPNEEAHDIELGRVTVLKTMLDSMSSDQQQVFIPIW